jgi:REP element-mobilizing transposase RayT
MTASESQPGNRSLRRGRISITGQIYHVTARTFERSQPFADPISAFAACHTIHRYFLGSASNCLAWVLMPDHAHWIVELAGTDSLSNTIGALKKAIATQVNVTRGSVGQTLWQGGFHDRALRKEDDVVVVARYIVANPVRAGLVTRVGDYPWWNAVWI